MFVRLESGQLINLATLWWIEEIRGMPPHWMDPAPTHIARYSEDSAYFYLTPTDHANIMKVIEGGRGSCDVLGDRGHRDPRGHAREGRNRG